MKKTTVLLLLMAATSAFAQNLKTSVDGSLLNQGAKGISAIKLRNTIHLIIDTLRVKPTKFTIGLGNVDNTSDLNKPISSAAQIALDNKQDKFSQYNGDYGVLVSEKIYGNPAPPDFLPNIFWENRYVDATNVDFRRALGINAKEDSIVSGTTSQFWRGDKTWQNVSSLPVSTATQIALDDKYDASNPNGFTKFSVSNYGGLTPDNELLGDIGEVFLDSYNGKFYQYTGTGTNWQLGFQSYPYSNPSGFISSSSAASTYATISNLNLKANIASPTFTGTVSGITKAMVGLGNTDNTSDANKPISTLTQSALNNKYDASNPLGFTKFSVSNYSGLTPNNELLGDVGEIFLDSYNGKFYQYTGIGTNWQLGFQAYPYSNPAGFISSSSVASTYATISNLNLKANLASPTFTGTVSGITKSMVGLGNVDNTSDVNKPISTLTQSALNNKYDASNPIGFTKFSVSNYSGLTPNNELLGDVGEIFLDSYNGKFYQYTGTGTNWQLGFQAYPYSNPLSFVTSSTAASTYAPIVSPTFTTNATSPKWTIGGAGYFGNGSDVAFGAGSTADVVTYNASGRILFSTNNLVRLAITNAGNFGIGTIAPTEKLELNGGNAKFSNSVYMATNTGNVGIGTTNPSYKLSINSSFAGANVDGVQVSQVDANFGNTHSSRFFTQQQGGGIGRTLFYAASNTTGVTQGQFDIITENGSNFISQLGTGYNSTTNTLTLYDLAGVAKNSINTNGNSFFNGGNVGIGTTTPSEKLEVSGNIKGTTGYFTNSLYVGAAAYTGQAFQYYKQSSNASIGMLTGFQGSGTNDFYFYQSENAAIEFFTNATSRLYIKNNGNVGIGTTSPSATLDVNGYARLKPMTTTEINAIASPSAGMIAYNSTTGKFVFYSTAWKYFDNTAM